MPVTKASREGYLLVDNRLAPPEPGIPRFLEAATLKCSHCERVLLKSAERTRAREWCSNCDAYLCDRCAAVKAVAGCKTYRAFLEQHERLVIRKRES